MATASLQRGDEIASFGTCDICPSTQADVVLEVSPRRLIRCKGCGLVRLHPTPTAHELSEVYDVGEYYTHERPRIGSGRSDQIRNAVLDTFWGYPNQQGVLSRALQRLALYPLRDRAMPVPFPGDAPVLDVGCGNGQRLLELQARGCTQLYGVEPTAGAAEQARLGTRADIRCCLLEDAGLPESHFQLIIMNQVLEHVPSPTATLNLVRRLLRPGGSLYFTVPNFGSIEAGLFGRHWSGLQIPAHLHHFTPRPLRRLLESCGYDIVTWRTDTVVAITAASIYDWNQAAPSAASRFALKLPRSVLAVPTLLADWTGRGQMLRVVARPR